VLEGIEKVANAVLQDKIPNKVAYCLSGLFRTAMMAFKKGDTETAQAIVNIISQDFPAGVPNTSRARQAILDRLDGVATPDSMDADKLLDEVEDSAPIPLETEDHTASLRAYMTPPQGAAPPEIVTEGNKND